jgi:hypothetical protein
MDLLDTAIYVISERSCSFLVCEIILALYNLNMCHSILFQRVYCSIKAPQALSPTNLHTVPHSSHFPHSCLSTVRYGRAGDLNGNPLLLQRCRAQRREIGRKEFC